MFELFFIIYTFGIFVAFHCACIDHIEKQNEKTIYKFPVMAVAKSIFSWFYVYFFINKYV